MEIEFASVEDIDAIARIEGECFVKEAWSKEMLQADFANRSIYLVSRLETGDVIGYLSMLDLDIEGEILRVAVKKQYRRKGVAKRMIQFLIEFLQEKNYQRLYLEVKSTNEEAIKLYESLGFTKYNERKNYYSEGEDALNYILLI
ncbi:MAG: ribosomal protein S18-alanine N-acetyltransferase [Christensenellales bacterium]